MKLLLFGATGSVGRHIMQQALQRGHLVTAVTRDAKKIKEEHPLLSVRAGDVLDYDFVRQVMEGPDAVLCTLGAGRKGYVRAAGTANILQAMQEHTIDRFICQTSLGCGDSWGNLNFFWKRIMFGWFLKETFTDHQNQEKHIVGSNCNWTIIRPAAFTNGRLTRLFKTGFPPDDTTLKLKIARADLAYYMLQQVDSPENLHKKVGISY